MAMIMDDESARGPYQRTSGVGQPNSPPREVITYNGNRIITAVEAAESALLKVEADI